MKHNLISPLSLIRTRLLLFIPAVLILFTTPAISLTSQTEEETLPKAIEDWSAVREPEIFKGEELFDLINGGAEIYFEYGFEEVAVADYERGEDMITVEIYRMTDSAYGIFSFLSGEEDEHIDLGNGGALTDYYLVFWSGRNLVTITAQTEFENIKEKLIAFAAALSERLPANGMIPALMELLPTDNRQLGSEKYLVGPIGLQNISTTAMNIFRGYKEVTAARYGNTESGECRLLIIGWAGEAEASAAFKAATDRLEGSTDLKAEIDRGVFSYTDQRDRAILACIEGKYVVLIIGSPCMDLDPLRERIRARMSTSD